MIKIYIKKQSGYPVSTLKLKKRLITFLENNGIVSDADVGIYIIGANKALALAKKHLGDNTVHNVLSFPGDEAIGEFTYPPDNTIHLGDIIICYPEVVKEAKKKGKRIDDVAYELAEHGALHLLGQHHE